MGTNNYDLEKIMDFNNYDLEKWPLSKIWVLIEEKKLLRPEWQRELKLEKGHEDRFIISGFEGDLNDTWKLSDLRTCNGFEEEVKEGKEYSYEDCQHRLASLEEIIKGDYFKKNPKKKELFLSIEVPVYIIKNRDRHQLSRKFSRVNSGRPVSNDHTLYIESSELNTKIKNELIINSKLVKSIYGIKKNGGFSEKIFYGNVIKILKVCGYYSGIVNNKSTKYSELLRFLNSDVNLFNDLLSFFKTDWYNIIKDVERKRDMWVQSSWFFILYVNKVKGLNYDIEKLKEIYNNLLNAKHINKKNGMEISITRCSPEKRYELVLNVFGYEE